ncbi:30S ribosomal protein S15 [Candidatus Wolfebacteria bacterium]|nr:30S ribosomal protein S15 [Candidatus Wolfebacteria bacterium]
MLTARKKKNIIEEHRRHETDTGSTNVQVSLLTRRISEVTDHLKKNLKDHHSRRGLLMMVGKRKRLLDHLAKSNPKSHASLIKKLGLKR